ncbi:unnamed protein product [Cladocopium goreaui]|uniref:Tyr recombinase domain-containing protein n=1 Tax=Cladocopium goreaui TaxID=2562237 RepID=A0A9P1C9Y5_9DINO|nr:unnamed protein product [Cladocopium goreaui]
MDFHRIWAECPADGSLKLPWEHGFWKTFFEGPTDPIGIQDWKVAEPPLFVPCASRAEPAPAKKLRVSEPLSWHHIVRSGGEQTWKDKREADFQVALRRWHDVLILLPCRIVVVQQLLHLKTTAERLRMLRDVFWKKAPSTLRKRVHSFLRFTSDLETRRIAFPGTETDFYAFLDELRVAGVVDDGWITIWARVRSELGISFEAGHPTMPAPLEDGGISMRPLSSEEMKQWTSILLHSVQIETDGRRLTSHSCKCTLLSWCSKRGLPWEDRLVLGGHTSAVRSALVYARDSLGRPLRMLEKLLLEVRLGRFLPDATRSGRFPTAFATTFHCDDGTQSDFSYAPSFGLVEADDIAANNNSHGDLVEPAERLEKGTVQPVADQACKVEAPESVWELAGSSEVIDLDTCSEDSGCSVATTSSSSDEGAAELSSARRPVHPPKVPSQLKLIQHRKLKTLHLMELQNQRVMLCGRVAETGTPVATGVSATPANEVVVGIPREPADFIRDAVRKGHPRDIIAQVPKEIKDVVQSMLDGDMSGRFKSRATSFGPSFKSLGVVFDVGAIPDGTFTLQHTESRKSELIQFLDNLIRTLTDLKHAIGSSKPVVISKTLCTTWYVFTDGAYEPDSDVPASVGAVLISPTGTPVQCFGEIVPKTLVDELLQHSSHPIYELEVLPVVMATRLWMKYLMGCPTVYFLDNVAARATYIKGVGATPPSILLLKDFVRLEARLKIYSWFGRVPSHSNVADSPSRLVFDDPVLSGCPRIRMVLPTHIHEIGDGTG